MPPLQTRIGAMRESLAIQTVTETTSTGTGFRTGAASTVLTIPAEYLQPAGGREAWEQSAVVAELGPRFRVRYRTDIEPKQKATWRGRTLQIHAVIPVMTVGNRFLILECGYTE